MKNRESVLGETRCVACRNVSPKVKLLSTQADLFQPDDNTLLHIITEKEFAFIYQPSLLRMIISNK